MAEKKKYNSILISGRKDQTLTYSKYVKDEESGESVKESLDKKVNVTDELTTQQIKDGAITNEKMAADSVGNANLQDGSVSNEKLEDGSITNEKLAENSITKDKLQDKTIGVEKLDNELRQTIAAATGLPEDLVETIQNVDDTLKDHQSQLDEKQSQIDDKQQQITANDKDISLLQTRSTQMEETIKSIAATGGASQATAVTYNNEKSKLTAVNIQSAVDEVVDKTAIKDEEGTVVETPFRYIQNEEFIFANVDAEDKLLFGIQYDGTPVFGKTSAVEDRLQSQVTLLAERVATIMGDKDTTNVIDTMNELKKFFAEIENTETLTGILANLDNVAKNLDKTTIKDEEGNVQDTPFRVIENEEFIMAVVDSDDRALFGIYRATGKPYYPQNDMYHISQSEEFLWVILDAANHPLLGIQQDGTCWAAKAQWLDDIKDIKKALNNSPVFLTALADAESYSRVDLSNQTISILGDSLSTFNGYIPSDNLTYYPDEKNDVNSVEQTWWARLISMTNAKLDTNNSYSGSKVSGSDDSCFTKRVEKLGNPDYIIIHGGTNDVWQNVAVGSLHFDNEESALNVNEFADSYDLLVRKCKSLYPYSNIFLVIPSAVLNEYTDVIKKIAKHYNLFGLVDLHMCSFEMSNRHYQSSDMETIANIISRDILINKNVFLKENGKSLISAKVANSLYYISNDEYVWAVIDANDRILLGVKSNGEPYLPSHEMYKVIVNDEWLYAIIDAEGKILCGFRSFDGHLIVEGNDINSISVEISRIKERTEHLSVQHNDEYLAVEEDADGKVIGYIAPDGSHYFHKVKSETIPTEFEHIEDPEGRTEITTDAEGKVMSFRDLQGKKHEHNMEVSNLDVSNLNLKGNSVNDIQDALKANGFSTKSLMDWSDNSEIHIPEPNCAFANIIGEFPTTKGNTTKGIIQFYDMQGNYFQKYIEMDIHGRTSAGFKKKNYTFDFYNDEGMTDSFVVKFGNWVAFDSYYFQGWYTDSFRGIDIIAYKLYQKIIGTHGCMKDKPYKYTTLSNISSEGSDNETNIDINLGKNSLCTPMGFPVIMYHNGEFWGIYTVMLKKNRDNFLMSKKDYTSIMLDLDQINVVAGDLKWDSFEIRNPKTLICMDGSKYNGDSPKELIDETSNVYDASNTDMKNTIKTKTALKNLCQAYNDIQKAIEAKKTNEEIRNLIEQHYNVDYIIDYILFSNIIENVDGWGGNWQWSTWDGVKWNPNPYDLNATFGLDPYGVLGNPPSTTISSSSIASIVYQYYLNEITARYSELRKEGVVSVEYISNLFDEWVKRIGTENYSKEFKKWNTTPSQRDSNLNKEYWKRVSKVLGSYLFSSYSEEVSFKKNEVVWYQWKLYKSLIDGNQGNSLSDSEKWECVSYDNTKEYNIGDKVYCTSSITLQFECIKNCVGQSPITKYYEETYGIFGFHDSIGRIYKWLQERIKILDGIFKYN